MNSNSRNWMTLAVGLVVAIAGCGGCAKPPAAAPPAAANAPPGNAPPAPIHPNPAPAQVANAGTENPGSPVAAEEESEPVPPSPDEFEINPDQTVTEIAGEFVEPPPAPVDVVALAPGLDSSTLEIASADNVNVPQAAVSPVPAVPLPAPGDAATKPATKSSNKSATKTAGAATKGKEQEEEQLPEPTAAGWQLPIGVTAVASAGTDAETGLPLRITLERDPVEMVLIPPGVFLEGIDGRDPQAAPQHSVLLENPYYIDVVEVTVARHDAFREFYRKSEGRKMEPAANHDGNPENPAVGIKYLDAKFYAKWTGKELPTEAQWERAARGSQGFSYPWGNGRPIWHQPRQPGQLDPVAMFGGDVSPYGVHDMAGNAREWCLDLYSSDSYRKDVATGGGTVRNPVGPKTFQGAKLQVVKGGKTDWAVWHRTGVAQNETAPDLGFRCVLNIAAAAKEEEKPARGSEKKKKAQAF